MERPANVPTRHWDFHQARLGGATYAAIAAQFRVSPVRARSICILTAYRLHRGPGKWQRDPWPAIWRSDEMDAARAWHRGEPVRTITDVPLFARGKTLAHWTPTTNRMLADAAMIREICDTFSDNLIKAGGG